MKFPRKTIVPGLGSKWLCIVDFFGIGSIGEISYQSGEIYKSKSDGMITDGFGNEYFWRKPNDKTPFNIVFDLSKYFRQIPRNKRYNGKYYKYKEG